MRYIAGVNSGGDCCDYGHTDQYARLASAGSKAWIDASIAADAAQAVGDCSTWAAGGADEDTAANIMQPFAAVFPQQCIGQLSYFRPT